MIPFLLMLVAFVKAHEAVVGLFAIALIVTMKEQLPYPFNKVDVLNWAWSWMHDSLKTFVNMRSPKTPDAPKEPEPPKV
jgi:hypothetical protein